MTDIAPTDARPPFVLAIDAGSSSIRAAVHDAGARAVAGWEGRERHAFARTADGGLESDARALLDLLARAVGGALKAAGPRAREIAAVGMASFASSLVGVTKDGRALTPLYPYSDPRPAAAARELAAELDGDAVHERTGCRLHTSYLPARLRWLQVAQPDLVARVARWVSLPEFVSAQLFGAARAGYAVASWTGLLDRRTLEWDAPLLDHLCLDPAALSPLGDEPFAGLRAPWAERWPALTQLPWFFAWTDGAAANAGSGCGQPGRAALSIGTTAALRVVTETPPESLPPALWCYRLDRERALVGGALNEGGGTVAWARELLRIDDLDAVELAIAAAEPDDHGLTVLPFLSGERSPGWDAAMRTTIAGMSGRTRPEHILQALMEAVAYRLALTWSAIDACAPGAVAIVASGGAAEGSPAWLRIIADVLGRPVSLSSESEATARGVAALTLAAIGRGGGVEPPPIARIFTPNPARHERYSTALARHTELYDAVRAWEGR